MFEKLFWLRDMLENSPFRGKILAADPSQLLRSERYPDEPVRIECATRGELQDLIWTTRAGIFLISERVRALLHRGGFTGWKTYPVEVVELTDGRTADYHGFAVTGRCGPFDPTKSQSIIKPPPVPQGRPAPYLKGLFFDPLTWDGSDVFCSENGWLFVVVTQSVRDLFQHHKITNVRFERLVDVERRT